MVLVFTATLPLSCSFIHSLIHSFNFHSFIDQLNSFTTQVLNIHCISILALSSEIFCCFCITTLFTNINKYLPCFFQLIIISSSVDRLSDPSILSISVNSPLISLASCIHSLARINQPTLSTIYYQFFTHHYLSSIYQQIFCFILHLNIHDFLLRVFILLNGETIEW